MALYVKFWGTRGSIPTPGPRTARYGGNTSCVEIRTERTVLICDGGTGLRELGVDLLRRYGTNPITVHLFFSHPHWDHIQGFPFFGPAYVPTNTLYVYGASKQDQKIHQLLSGQMQSTYFPVSFADLGAKIVARDFEQGVVDVDDVKVTSFGQQHPGGSLGFCFEHEGTRVVYSTDNELDQLLPEGPEADPHALRVLPPQAFGFPRAPDLLISDGQYTDAEYPKKRGWGHPRATTAVDFAIQAGAKQLALYHHDPMHSDREVDEKIAACAGRAQALGAPLAVFGAREGLELKLG